MLQHKDVMKLDSCKEMNVHYTHYTIAMEDHTEISMLRSSDEMVFERTANKLSASASSAVERICSSIRYRRRNSIDSIQGSRITNHGRFNHRLFPPIEDHRIDRTTNFKNGGSELYTPPQPLMSRRNGVHLESVDLARKKDECASENVMESISQGVTIKSSTNSKYLPSMNTILLCELNQSNFSQSQAISIEKKKDITIDSSLFVRQLTPIRDITLRSALLCSVPRSKSVQKTSVVPSESSTNKSINLMRFPLGEDSTRYKEKRCDEPSMTSDIDINGDKFDIRLEENVTSQTTVNSPSILEKDMLISHYMARRRSIPEIVGASLSLSDRAVVMSKASSSRSVVKGDEIEINVSSNKIPKNFLSDFSPTPLITVPTEKVEGEPKSTSPVVMPRFPIRLLIEKETSVPYHIFSVLQPGMSNEQNEGFEGNDDDGTDVRSDENVQPCHSSGGVKYSMIHQVTINHTSKEHSREGLHKLSAQSRRISTSRNKSSLLSRWDNIETRSEPPQHLDSTFHQRKQIDGLITKRNLPIQLASKVSSSHMEEIIRATRLDIPLQGINSRGGHIEDTVEKTTENEYSLETSKSSSLQPMLTRRDIEKCFKNMRESKNSSKISEHRLDKDLESLLAQSCHIVKKKTKEKKLFREKDQKFVYGVRLISGPKHVESAFSNCRDSRPVISHRPNWNPHEGEIIIVDPNCLLRRHLYSIPEEIVVVAAPEIVSKEGKGVKEALDVIGLAIDSIQRRRRKRRRKRQQISNSHTMCLTTASSSLGVRRMTHSIEIAQSFVRVARLHAQNGRHQDAYFQYVDALQFCIKQGMFSYEILITFYDSLNVSLKCRYPEGSYFYS
jgi:hypothetical protein